VPIELRVFLTAAVIIDDIVAILVIALFYTGDIYAGYLIASGAPGFDLASAISSCTLFTPVEG